MPGLSSMTGISPPTAPMVVWLKGNLAVYPVSMLLFSDQIRREKLAADGVVSGSRGRSPRVSACWLSGDQVDLTQAPLGVLVVRRAY